MSVKGKPRRRAGKTRPARWIIRIKIEIAISAAALVALAPFLIQLPSR